MVHSIELVFDDETETTVRRIWSDLAAAGLPGQAAAARPHVTLAVAQRIDPRVDDVLAEFADRLPLACTLGATLIFGRSHGVLARLVVPNLALLELHRETYRRGLPYLAPAPLAHVAPGQWTAHVTLARRMGTDLLGRAQRIAGSADIAGRFAGLRRWDGDTRTQYPITGA
ncbi:2'-5' RNA ligase family protein [[Mycobacterium] kokjensenii]|uniref:2'-5' RNA ligase family protein n=1 Tax=[Mycobacterium] kokjensenii TaxID=3064287 RepID=A0ABM9LGR7_9MYCO|nr:2'-5' RNA ligase family protein [Mycolicibacter sp. MU0083]CAJ1498776.1 2'-5' RNA ligase family protein [Mycolicibacter sp. MU0083]